MQFEPVITFSGVASFVAIIGGFFTIVQGQRKNRRENEADSRARTDEIKDEFRDVQNTLGARITKLEQKAHDFMPRAEIEGKIDHEKSNRVAADQALKETIDRAVRDVVDIKVSIGKVEQRQEGLTSDMADVKTLVKEQGKELNAKLDKLGDAVAHIGRQAP